MEYFSGKNVLLISPEPWKHLFVSKHHYAIELSKNNKVYFLNPPTEKFAVHETKYNNVWEVNYISFIRGLRFLPGFLQRWFIRRKFRSIERLTSVKFDCIWSFDNSVFFDFSTLPKSVLCISHIVDYSQNFELKRAARTADLCIGLSANIVGLLKEFNPHTYLLPHGIAILRAEHREVTLPGQNRVKAIFAGNLDRKHFDRQVLLSLADAYPQVDFIFFGSGGKDWTRKPNTFYPGVVESEILHNYLAQADVLLLPYKVKDYEKELTNSHKVLEYLSSGNIVVSSFLADYADNPDLFVMVNNNEDFVPAFGEVIKNLSFHNSEANKAVRRNFAMKNTYAKRLEEIEGFISRLH